MTKHLCNPNDISKDTNKKTANIDSEEEQLKIFSENLNYYISLSGKSQLDVANDLDIKVTTFNTWCTGNSMPSFPKLKKIADYFKISVVQLCEEHLTQDNAKLKELEYNFGLLNDSNKDILIKMAITLKEHQ